MKFIITLLLSVCSYALFSQTLSVKGKLYPATETYKLMRNSGFNDKLEISFAKNKNQGLMVLTIDSRGIGRITKSILYLEDGSVITCLDKGIYDEVDGTTTSVFYLTQSEIQKLKSNNIYNVRFSFRDDYGHLENFSATNKDDPGILYTEKIDFPSIITELFENN